MARHKTDKDPELEAMAVIRAALDRLSPDSRRRTIRWICDRWMTETLDEALGGPGLEGEGEGEGDDD